MTALFHSSGIILVIMDIFIIWHIITKVTSLHNLMKQIDTPSSPVALESELAIINFVTSSGVVGSSWNIGISGFVTNFRSIALVHILEARLIPMVEKHSFNSVAISSGVSLPCRLKIGSLSFEFLRNHFRTFHNLELSPCDSVIEFWKKRRRSLFIETTLFWICFACLFNIGQFLSLPLLPTLSLSLQFSNSSVVTHGFLSSLV